MARINIVLALEHFIILKDFFQIVSQRDRDKEHEDGSLLNFGRVL